MSLPSSENGQPDIFKHSNQEILKAICECIRNNDKDSLRRWLEIGKRRPFNARNLNETTPLHLAASKDEYKECLELVLKYKDVLRLNINGKTRDGDTALYLACSNGCHENVLILCQNRCNVNERYKYSPLDIAVRNLNLRIAQYLIDYGANIDKKDFEGKAPLHWAALWGHLDVARFLLEKGANTRLLDKENHLPLYLACENGHYDMIRLLLEHDPSIINYQDINKSTSLMVASRNGLNERCVRLLHEYGASFSIQDRMGRLALHYAARNGNVEVLQYVLEHTDASSIEQCFNDILGLLENKKPIDSLTCCAIDSRNLECLETLLSSNKLSTRLLQIPRICKMHSHYEVYSPLELLFCNKVSFASETFDLYLRFLLQHNLTMLNEFGDTCKMVFPIRVNNLRSPFSEMCNSAWPFVEQQYYLHWLNTNGITIDYCLQCYYDNTQLFASFNDYRYYYKPVLKAILDNNVEALIIMMSTSAILEPDKLIVQMNMLKIDDNLTNAESTSQCHASRNIFLDKVSTGSREEHCNIYNYLISLKPIFHTHAQVHDLGAKNKVWFPCHTPNPSREFAESTLKQLCRTTIRQNLRKITLEANLRDFRRNILELPLPPSLKDYLLFKS